MVNIKKLYVYHIILLLQYYLINIQLLQSNHMVIVDLLFKLHMNLLRPFIIVIECLLHILQKPLITKMNIEHKCSWLLHGLVIHETINTML